jgi:hypothetical protein
MTQHADDSRQKKLDTIATSARKTSDTRAQGYRERALGLYPWICGRCSREFDRTNLAELTVHHRDHNHDNNPADGSNWELLCLYCHDNEHQRQLEADLNPTADEQPASPGKHNPFAQLKEQLKATDP